MKLSVSAECLRGQIHRPGKAENATDVPLHDKGNATKSSGGASIVSALGYSKKDVFALFCRASCLTEIEVPATS